MAGTQTIAGGRVGLANSRPRTNTLVADLIAVDPPLGALDAIPQVAGQPLFDPHIWKFYRRGKPSVQPGQAGTGAMVYLRLNQELGQYSRGPEKILGAFQIR